MMPGSPAPRIGYSTLDVSLTAPGDRRRFCYYAARRSVPFEIARPGGRYDLVVSNVSGDLSAWRRLPSTTNFILDMVDSYLAVPRGDPRAVLRGLFKFVFGHTRHLHLDFRRLIEECCRRADAVICSTEEQRQSILAFCPNVHIILDFQPEARSVKSTYARSEVFHVVWEGLPQNLGTFREIAGALKALAGRHPLAIHLVTDLEYARGSTHFWVRPTQELVHEIFEMERVNLYQWNADFLPVLCTASDLAVIPIPLGEPFFLGKPENKLVFFWRMGIPVVTSATPAYERAMKGAGLAMTCRTPDEWVTTIERYMSDESARREAGQRGLAYAREAYSEASLIAKWDQVFDSVMHP